MNEEKLIWDYDDAERDNRVGDNAKKLSWEKENEVPPSAQGYHRMEIIGEKS